MDYKILTGTKTDVQKILNQWKHQYIIEILGFSAVDIDGVSILLTRTPK